MTTTISSKWQVTIPARLRRKLRLQPGMKLEFDEQAPYLSARPAFDEKAMRGVLGCARQVKPGKTSRQVLAELRGYERAKL
jgi:AbrB family looped-hinge helix DNA binding protein